MKKILYVAIFSFFLLINVSFSMETIKGGIEKSIIPSGFFGSWAVSSKLSSSNNPPYFNYKSEDIWLLSGSGNKLILENTKSGARSEIIVKEKVKDGKTLKFEREKTVHNNNGEKIIYKEKVEFTLLGDAFSGVDYYKVEKYDKDNKLINNNVAKYAIMAVKIAD